MNLDQSRKEIKLKRIGSTYVVCINGYILDLRKRQQAQMIGWQLSLWVDYNWTSQLLKKKKKSISKEPSSLSGCHRGFSTEHSE